jgi:hypothetical protein
MSSIQARTRLITTGETSSEALRQANERSYALLQKPIAP